MKISFKIFCVLLFFVLSVRSQASQRVKGRNHLSEIQLLDSILSNSFRQASNSKDFLIIRSNDYNKLENIAFDIELQINEMFARDSIKFNNSQAQVDSLKQQIILLNNLIESQPSEDSYTSSILILRIIISVAVLSLLLLFIKIYFQGKYITGLQEAFLEVENAFQTHKRKSVEKERRLKRELIDAHSKLEAFEGTVE